LITEAILRFITPFILIAIGIFVETRYPGRVAMFTNAAALYIFYHPVNMPFVLGLIVNIAIILGLIAGFARIFKIRLVSEFYQVGWIASSAVTAVLLFYGLVFGLVS